MMVFFVLSSHRFQKSGSSVGRGYFQNTFSMVLSKSALLNCKMYKLTTNKLKKSNIRFSNWIELIPNPKK